MASSSSSSSSFTPRWNHDVFLSFRGEDTRKTFTGHLFKALERAGIFTFMDAERLRVGDEISPVLMKAIEESKISIIVFSTDYASSRWCLDELVQIIECANGGMGHKAIPVFYNVEPSEVRNQMGSFAEAFDRHEGAFKREKVQRWRDALTAAANISGWDSRTIANGDDSELIQTIVREISSTLISDMPLNVAEHTVGIEYRLKKMNRLIGIGTNDVRMVGIWGMGGIGKTTIAKAVYKQISGQFDGCCFLANVREVSMEPSGLVHLQKQLLSEILKGINIELNNVDKGITVIRERLRYKKVLIVLDDVDHREQLVKLAGDRDWFGSGSRIIITTRDEGLLKERKVDELYEAMELNPNEALQLFSLHAFRENQPPKNIYAELSKRAIEYAKGLPLALKVLGSFLSSKGDCDEWKAALDKLERIPNMELQKVLRISFDGLNQEEKDIFLDIACFFKGKDKYSVTKILESCDFFPHVGVGVLIHKSLVTIIDGKLSMHDLLQEMGKGIIREESPSEPGKRSRVWSPEDAYNVLTKKTGTEAVEGIIVDLSRFKGKNFSTEAFLRMSKLRFLKIYNPHISGSFSYLPDEELQFGFDALKRMNALRLLKDCKVHRSGDFEFLSNELRCLYWEGYPFKSLPSNFHPENIVELNLCYSRIKQLWKGIKNLEKLIFIELSHSQYLIKSPDFSGVRNIERLVLEGCTGLREVHPSIGLLKRLVYLNLKDCKNLMSLPDSICKLKSLEYLNLDGCSQLDKLPENLGDIECLLKLDASETAIKHVPSSIVLLKNLTDLSFRGCKGAPSTSWPLFSSCLLPRKDPEFMGLILPASFSGLCSLTKLDLKNCNLMEGTILSDLGFCSSLKYLELDYCKGLKAIPQLPSRLDYIYANGCTSLETLPSPSKASKLRWLDFPNCFKLVENHHINSMAITLLKSVIQVTYNVPEEFCITGAVVLPGREIPEWFRDQNMGSSVSIQLSPHWCNSKFMGLALCGVFAPPHLCHGSFTCRWKSNDGNCSSVESYIYLFRDDSMCIQSDHVWLTYQPLIHWRGTKYRPNRWSQLEVSFPTEVKKCGIRLVYGQDGEEFSTSSDNLDDDYEDEDDEDEDGGGR